MVHVRVRSQDARSVSHERNNPNLYTFRAGIWAVDPSSHELPEDELQQLAHPVQAKPAGFVEFVKGLEGYNPQTINKKSLAFRSEFIPGINVDASHEPDTA